MGSSQRWWSAAADLAVGADCAGCGAPGLDWCPACASACRPRPRLVPSDLGAPTVALLDNAGSTARIVVAWKDRGRQRLTAPLGDLLAVGCALLPTDGGLGLVPVPTAAAQVRRRGGDPVLMLAARAAQSLRAVGVDAVAHPALRRVRRTRDQVGLAVAERHGNVAGAFAAAPDALAACVRAGVREVVVVDDVLTTGASVREAVRALRAAGVRPAGVVVVAHTPSPRARPTEK